MFNWVGAFSFVKLSENYFFFALGCMVFTYIFFILYILSTFIKKQNRISNIFSDIYHKNEKIILVSIIFTASSVIPIFASAFLPSVIPDFYKATEYVGFNNFYFILKLICAFVIFLVVKIIIKTGLGKAFIACFVGALLSVLIFFIIQVFEEFSPSHYLTFPLDDKKGRYLINYDGDYWLTYYDVQKSCMAQSHGENVCKEVLIKKGNSSITETPVDLKQYIDVPIHVSGEFVKTHGSTYEGKQICAGKGFSKECSPSTGPGTWYASPLKIKTITPDK